MKKHVKECTYMYVSHFTAEMNTALQTVLQ